MIIYQMITISLYAQYSKCIYYIKDILIQSYKNDLLKLIPYFWKTRHHILMTRDLKKPDN